MTTPKNRFLESGDNIAAHRKMVDSREFQRGIDYSLMDYVKNLSDQVKDGNTAMAVGFMLKATWEYIEKLQTLSEQPKPVTKVVTPNLTHS